MPQEELRIFSLFKDLNRNVTNIIGEYVLIYTRQPSTTVFFNISLTKWVWTFLISLNLFQAIEWKQIQVNVVFPFKLFEQSNKMIFYSG